MIEHAATDQIFIRKLTEIILLNLEKENFGEKELSSETALTIYSLNRRLKEITGKTISQFIRETRLNRALEMLQKENINASEVAYKVGFSSPAYFNTCFHAFFGYPPGKVSKEVFNTAEELNPILIAEDQEQKGRVWRTFLIITSGILFLAVLVSLGYIFLIKNPATIVRISLNDLEKSIAVLPFKNLNDTIANQYFFDGLMEEILTDLCRIHDLRVISRSSVEQFRQSNKSTAEIAKKLGVNYIVEGSGQKYGNKFRLRVQLIRAKGKETHLWARSYEQEIRGTKDIFGIQSEIAQSIAAELKATITPEEKQLIEKIPTNILIAYDFYRKAREEHWFDNIVKFKNKNKLSLERAENMYRKALEKDSAFALAYVGLAKIYWDRYHNKAETYFTENYLDSVLILCNIALSYDDQLADAHTFIGKYYRDRNKTEEAFMEYDKAISLNPNDWMAYWEKGDLYFWMGDFIHSLELSEKTISLYRGEELPDMLRSVGEQFMWAGFSEKAVYYWKQTLELDNDSSMFYNYLSLNECWLGNFEKSIEYRDKAYALDSKFVDYLDRPRILSHIFLGHNKEALKCLNQHFESNKTIGQKETILMYLIGYVYWINGDKEKAEYYFEETIKDCYRQLDLGRQYILLPYVYYDLAAIYAFRGEKDKAFKYLRIFSQKDSGDVTTRVMLKNEPMFNSIMKEPEFQQMVRKLEASYLAMHEKVRKWLEERGKL